MRISPGIETRFHRVATAAAFIATLLAGCGGGGDTSVQPRAASEGVSLQLPATALAGTAVDAQAHPTYHAAPVLLDAPDGTDAANNEASAHMPAHAQAVPAQWSHLSTKGLTVQALEASRREASMSAQTTGEGMATAQGNSSSVVSTYTPAQIRAAYGLPSLSGGQAAQLGAGQTIYIVNAYHDPNIVAELGAFTQKFGLPACTVQPIATNARLPLATASASAGCSFSVVYSTDSATMTTTAPTYDAGWATEIALDVQWVHATAPLARIVLIEASSASVNSLVAAVKLANAMGPGVVSMSFGAAEGSWTASQDAVFTGTGITYVAATGDAGAEVNWPSVSASVLAVGGTTLTYTGSGARTEVAWSMTGGGVSQFTPKPNYQASNVPGMGSPAHRSVADVAFNADPRSGQYVAVIPNNSSTTNWISAGGTSLATPQWAGLIAIGNAVRAQSGKSTLGSVQPVLYNQIAVAPGSYASVFADIASGANGSCAGCTSKLGYDIPTGLGTPNVSNLLSSLAGGSSTATPPVVASATVTGKQAIPLSFTVSVSALHTVTYSLAGTPSGMAISDSGVLTWAAPVAGTYAVTVSATDIVTGLTGKGTLTVTIAKPVAPVISAPAMSGNAGTPLTGTINVSDPNGYGLSLTISGVPPGMTLAPSGGNIVATWPKPVFGTYTLSLTARNSIGSTTQVSTTITVAKSKTPLPAVFVGSALVARTGSPFMTVMSGMDLNGGKLSFTISGAPPGVTLTTAGVLSWNSPLRGSYSFTISALAPSGIATPARFTLTVN